MYKPEKCCCLQGFSISQTCLQVLSTSSFGHFKFMFGGRGKLPRFPLEFCRETSLSPERPSSDISACKVFPCGRLPAVCTCCPGHQPSPSSRPRTASWASNGAHRDRGLPAENFSLCSRKQSNSLKLWVTGSLAGLLQHRKSPGRVCNLRGWLTWGAGIPLPPATAGSTKPDPSLPSLIHTRAATAPTAPSFCCLFLSLSQEFDFRVPSEH